MPMNKGIRLVNFLIDLLVIALISVILVVILANPIYAKPASFLVFFFYYFVLELVFGKTIGKMVTKTKVVNLHEEQPGALLILIRTLLRFNPFDTLSYLFGISLGTHDVLSKTQLRED